MPVDELPATTAAELSQFDEACTETPLAKNDHYSDIPDGHYAALIQEARVTATASTGKPMTVWTFSIHGPITASRTLPKTQVITGNKLTEDLRKCGLDLERLSELPPRIQEIEKSSPHMGSSPPSRARTGNATSLVSVQRGAGPFARPVNWAHERQAKAPALQKTAAASFVVKSKSMRVLGTLLLVSLVPAVLARQPVRARNAMVVAQEPLAADVGVATLKAGGNAVDAAVAVALALSVTHPSAGNLGGGGFLLARLADGRSTFIDFRERAPEKAASDMYLDAAGKLTRDSQVGWRAAGVPGTVRGLEYAHKKYGRKPWAGLVAPAIKLAGEGFPVSYSLARSLRSSKLLAQFPESKRIFQNGGKYYEAGEKLVQPELARTLERIARDGARDFYQGETARRLAAGMKANGGPIALEDLNNYAVVERKVLEGRYRGCQILTAPPPSSGGIGILQMMGVLEKSGYEKHGAGSAAAIHFVAEVMRRYYADRAEFLADPDFVKIPVAGLLAPRYLDKLRASIDPLRASSSEAIGHGNPADFESAETTHFSIVDSEGNAVALTYTINGGYGCGVTVPGLGFLLNNEMDDFSAQPGAPNMFGLVQGEANAIAPRKRPLSSMTPTILLRDGKLYMVLGAPGGGRIITGVMQVILNVLDFGMNPQEAIDWPRFHHQWKPDKLALERGFSPDTVALLKARGHQIEQTSSVAAVEAIRIENGWLEGASDGRGNGKAAGY